MHHLPGLLHLHSPRLPARLRYPRKSRKEKTRLDGRERQVSSGKNRRVVAARPGEEAVVPAREIWGKPSAQIHLVVCKTIDCPGRYSIFNFFFTLAFWRRKTLWPPASKSWVLLGNKPHIVSLFFSHPAYFILFFSFIQFSSSLSSVALPGIRPLSQGGP